ncbi:hypothetical protein [Streptomyces sp. MH60]|uniref:hypothetical protein n=1 Tax=Streptomyces sp. MH60 TaxID=1940758 RepID=UPI000D480ADC|nr:hypothetical protein [Streptomyces sp. MH60]PPS90889.1 hypothetical protein BZZ08_00487 [Streptomyces sp. MH60]
MERTVVFSVCPSWRPTSELEYFVAVRSGARQVGILFGGATDRADHVRDGAYVTLL